MSLFFSFTKPEYRKAEHITSGGGLVPVWGGGGKCVGGWIWYKYCVHMYLNEKMRPIETIPGMGEGG
jgi:hypothetical protein